MVVVFVVVFVAVFASPAFFAPGLDVRLVFVTVVLVVVVVDDTLDTSGLFLNMVVLVAVGAVFVAVVREAVILFAASLVCFSASGPGLLSGTRGLVAAGAVAGRVLGTLPAAVVVFGELAVLAVTVDAGLADVLEAAVVVVAGLEAFKVVLANGTLAVVVAGLLGTLSADGLVGLSLLVVVVAALGDLVAVVAAIGLLAAVVVVDVFGLATSPFVRGFLSAVALVAVAVVRGLGAVVVLADTAVAGLEIAVVFGAAVVLGAVGLAAAAGLGAAFTCVFAVVAVAATL